MSEQSQFGLLTKRRFGPYFLTQFLGAFNDNLFKNALLILVAFGAARSTSEIGLLNNIAAGLFILPFFLFALLAGNLADTVDKAKIIRTMKTTELLLALAAVPALLSQNIFAMLAILFGFGLQSAFFAPAKYSILPQHLGRNELVSGNALVQMGTFIAILTGTLIGGMMAASEATLPWLAGFIVLVAVLGLISGYKVPQAPARVDKSEVEWRPVAMFKKAYTEVSKVPGVMLGIVGVSWFWFLGAVILTQLPGFSKEELGVGAHVVSVLLALFSVGIGLGSVLCSKLSHGRIEVGLIPIGAIGMAIFGYQFAWSEMPVHEALLDITSFFASVDGWWTSLKVVAIGLFGGLYIVPLMSHIQARAPESIRGRAMALNSLTNALFMVLAAGFSIFVLVVLELDTRTLIAWTAIGNVLVLLVFAWKSPEYFLRMVMWILARGIYRLKVNNRLNIPEEGPVIIVANHVTFIDWLLLGAASPRPIHFVLHKPFYDFFLFKPLMKMAGAIPILTRAESREAYDFAMQEMISTVKKGNVMVIFPEGKITRTGEMNVFHRGFQTVLEQAPAKVIPAALHGLWGSFFSRRWGKAMSKPFRRVYSKVEVEFGEAFEADIPEPKELRLKIQEMLDKKVEPRDQ